MFKKISNHFLNFFKGLYLRYNRNPDKKKIVDYSYKIEDDFVIITKIPNISYIESYIKINKNEHDQNIETICISPIITNYISKKQEEAYRIDKTGMEIVECCVCFSDSNDVEMLPLECAHPLCKSCYQEITKTNSHLCPLCRQKMNIIKIYKFIALIVPILLIADKNKIDDNVFRIPNNDSLHSVIGLGIIYYPPVHKKDVNEWINHEFFYDIMNNHYQQKIFINTYEKIINEKYVICCHEEIKKILDKISKNILVNFTIISSSKENDTYIKDSNISMLTKN